MRESIRGLIVATVTPFDKSDRVDLQGLRRHVEFLLDSGVDGLAPCGTTGEFLYLSVGEKVRVIEATVAAASGKTPVVAGIWSLQNREIAMLARAAESGGADAVFLQPPIYYPADDDAIVAHYGRVREACELPVFAYNIPAYAANTISLDCLERMVEQGMVQGIKDSTGKAEQMKALLDRFGERITVLAASDSFASEARKLGAHGFVSALANVRPELLARIWKGEDALQPEIDALRNEIKSKGGIPAIKELASQLGYAMGRARIPAG